MPFDREDFHFAFQDLKTDIRDGFSGVHGRLDALNSRTRKAESSIAVQWRLWIILGLVSLTVLGAALAR